MQLWRSVCGPELSVHVRVWDNTHTHCFMLQQVDQVDQVEEVDMAHFIQQLESHIATEVGDQLLHQQTNQLNLCILLQTC